MTVAQNQPVQFGRINIKKIKVAIDDLRCPTEIQQILGLNSFRSRNQMQGQTPFCDERLHKLAGDVTDVFDLGKSVGFFGKIIFISRVNDHLY